MENSPKTHHSSNFLRVSRKCQNQTVLIRHKNPKGDANVEEKHCQGRLALSQGTLPEAEESGVVLWSP